MVDDASIPLVFDASALVAFLKGEPGATTTEALLADTTVVRMAHAVNLCEVYYYFVRREEEERVERELLAFERMGLGARADIDPAFWRTVARLKAETQRISLGDCFAIALAMRVGGAVVTSDHAEFDIVAARSICPVLFIR